MKGLMLIQSWRHSLRKKIQNCKSLPDPHVDEGPETFLPTKATSGIISTTYTEDCLEMMLHR